MSAFRGQALCCTGRDRPTNNGDMLLHLASTRAGHGWDSRYSGASKFPRGGQSKKIVDAVRDLLESKEINARKNGDKRTISGEVDGVKIRVVYRIRDNEPYDMTAYPVSGKWVERNEH
ncbi:hypothetical protein A5774_04520 [Corynebacterium sp. EPI-003-04-2554_SCH2473622]|nr:hypothetical protein A5774_04520 [Corynebacterium sp. EPI-003-04-2554_SCH2473622]